MFELVLLSPDVQDDLVVFQQRGDKIDLPVAGTAKRGYGVSEAPQRLRFVAHQAVDISLAQPVPAAVGMARGQELADAFSCGDGHLQRPGIISGHHVGQSQQFQKSLIALQGDPGTFAKFAPQQRLGDFGIEPDVGGNAACPSKIKHNFR